MHSKVLCLVKMYSKIRDSALKRKATVLFRWRCVVKMHSKVLCLVKMYSKVLCLVKMHSKIRDSALKRKVTVLFRWRCVVKMHSKVLCLVKMHSKIRDSALKRKVTSTDICRLAADWNDTQFRQWAGLWRKTKERGDALPTFICNVTVKTGKREKLRE